jgi:hypothetical protein
VSAAEAALSTEPPACTRCEDEPDLQLSSLQVRCIMYVVWLCGFVACRYTILRGLCNLHYHISCILIILWCLWVFSILARIIVMFDGCLAGSGL